MERASLSSLPFGVDDPAKDTSQATDISNLIIEIFNEGKTSNLWKGSSKPLFFLKHLMHEQIAKF